MVQEISWCKLISWINGALNYIIVADILTLSAILDKIKYIMIELIQATDWINTNAYWPYNLLHQKLNNDTKQNACNK